MPNEVDHVSVVMPSHNSASTLEAAIQSVIGQTFDNWELLIVDDHSTDISHSIAASWAERDARVKQLRTPYHGGPALARNTGMSEASNRFIAFLDADDEWMNNKLECQLALHANTGCALSFTSYVKIDAEGLTLSEPIPVPEQAHYENLLRTNFIACSTAMIDREILGDARMPNILKRQDYAFWLSLTRRGHVANSLRQPLTRYRVHKGSLSANKIKAAYYHWKVLRKFEQINWARAVWYFLNYALISGRKYLK